MGTKLPVDNRPFTTVKKTKEIILDELKKNGLRITNQRKILLDIILENDCSCCKEIYYQAKLKDPTIGIATVYRMVKTLEEYGVIDRKNMYQIVYENMNEMSDGNMILLDQEKATEIKLDNLYELLKQTLKEHGYINEEEVSVVIKRSNQTVNRGNCHDRLCCSC